MQSPHGYPPPQKSQTSTIWIILAVLAVLAVVGLGVMSSLAIFGVRKYIANAKQAEVMSSLGQIQKDAVAAYEIEGLSTATRTLCPSASSPVPVSMSSVRGMKYLAAAGEWQKDEATNSGFFCLKFEMASPQYYQYDYQRTGSGTKPGDGFRAIGHGDLNGDGVASTYAMEGAIDATGEIALNPTMITTSPGE